MKRFIFFTAVLIGVITLSCSKNEDDNPNTFSATISQNFTDPLKNENNILVEDYIPYVITIADSRNDENVEYRLVAIREGQAYHQTIWKDFGLSLNTDGGIPDKEKKYITFSKKGEHKFYIQPFVAGTFRHTYELQKWVNGVQVGEAFKLNTSFNAVKISFNWSFSLMPGNSGFFFQIDDGEDDTDNYLNPATGKQKYTIKFEVKRGTEPSVDMQRFGDFVEGVRYYFFGGIPYETDVKIKEIRIEQYVSGLPTFTIQYNNIGMK